MNPSGHHNVITDLKLNQKPQSKSKTDSLSPQTIESTTAATASDKFQFKQPETTAPRTREISTDVRKINER